MGAPKRFTLDDLEQNNLQVARGERPRVYGGDVGLPLKPVGNGEYALPVGWELVEYHGYWLLGEACCPTCGRKVKK